MMKLGICLCIILLGFKNAAAQSPKIDTEKLAKINTLGEIMIATRHCNFPVKKGDKLA